MASPWVRPKLTIPKSKSEWIWDCIGYLCYVGTIIFLLSVWGKLPDEVPGHFNGSGEVDRWGSRWELVILPSIGLTLMVIMAVLEKHPEVYNYPKQLNESNAEQFYLVGRKIINQLKNMVVMIFSLISTESISIALGWGKLLGVWVLPIIIGGIMVPLAIGMVKLARIR